MTCETGTLKELNVQPGDVVEYAGHNKRRATVAGWHNGRCYPTGAGFGGVISLDSTGAWRIVSRATPPVDLTAITTPFGLLDAATQDALRAHGGPYEIWRGATWGHINPSSWLGDTTYRVKPTPKRETVTVSGLSDSGWNCILLVDLIDGKPDLTTVREAR